MRPRYCLRVCKSAHEEKNRCLSVLLGRNDKDPFYVSGADSGRISDEFE